MTMKTKSSQDCLSWSWDTVQKNWEELYYHLIICIARRLDILLHM
jgi:hypothetical protein